MVKENQFKLDLKHWDFLSGLAVGLWPYICQYYGEEVEMPETVVAFISDKMFKRFLKRFDLSRSIEKEYGSPKDARKAHLLYMGSASFDPQGRKTCRFIAIRKPLLQKARRFLIKHFHQDFSLPETILLGLIHETIHLYEEVTGRTFLNHSKTPLTEAEKTIFMWFKNDHPEYFSPENERNMAKTLRKIPNR
jgi:hypothetical protein